MDISDVRVKLIQDTSDRLKAVCTVTFDECFVVRDVKVVEGTNGLFVAMPSRKVAAHCPNCRQKNQLRATYCNFCGKNLPPLRPQPEGDGRSRMHKDLAHPITTEFREVVQTTVIAAYETELEQAPERPKDHPRPAKEQRSREDSQPAKAPDAAKDGNTQEIEPLEASEYNALIADLKKSSGSSNNRDTGKDSPRPRDGRDERPDRREPRERVSEPATVAPEAREVPEAPEAPEAQEAQEAQEIPRKEQPQVEPADETRRREPVESSRTAAATEPEVAAAEPEDDDTAGFGEGIL